MTELVFHTQLSKIGKKKKKKKKARDFAPMIGSQEFEAIDNALTYVEMTEPIWRNEKPIENNPWKNKRSLWTINPSL